MGPVVPVKGMQKRAWTTVTLRYESTPWALVTSPATNPPQLHLPSAQFGSKQKRRKVFRVLTSLQEPLCLAPCPFVRHLAESDNNNRINFQQFQLKEKRVQCFLSQKHRELNVSQLSAIPGKHCVRCQQSWWGFFILMAVLWKS